MLKFLELCQSSSWAQIMFPYQDLSTEIYPWTWPLGEASALSAVSVGGVKLMTHQPGIGGPCPLDGLIHRGWDFSAQEAWGGKSSVKAAVQMWAERERLSHLLLVHPASSLSQTSALCLPHFSYKPDYLQLQTSWEQVPTSLVMVKGGSVERLRRVCLPKPTPWFRQSGSRRLLEKRLDLTVHEGQGLRRLFFLFNTFLLFWFFSFFECVKMGNDLISRKKPLNCPSLPTLTYNC